MAVRFCYVCKQEIEPDRAVGLPNTILCGVHGAEIEKYGGEFIVSSEPIRTDKGGIKVNIGSHEVQQRPNWLALNQVKEDFLLSQDQ